MSSVPRPQTYIHICVALKCHVPSNVIANFWGSRHLFAEQSLLFTQWASHMGPGTKEEPDLCSCAVWNHRFLTPSLTAPQPQHEEMPVLHPKSPVQDKGCWGHCRSWVSWCPEFRIHSRPCNARRGSQMSWYSLDSLQGGEAGKPCRSAAQPGQILPNPALQYVGSCPEDPATLGLRARCPSCPSFPSLHYTWSVPPSRPHLQRNVTQLPWFSL